MPVKKTGYMCWMPVAGAMGSYDLVRYPSAHSLPGSRVLSAVRVLRLPGPLQREPQPVTIEQL